MRIAEVLDLETYPLDRIDTPDWLGLVAQKRRDWLANGAFSLPGLVRSEMAAAAARELTGPMEARAHRHEARHNIYFSDETEGLPLGVARHALRSSHRTLTCDRMAGTLIRQVYEWDPLRHFLRTVMDLPALYRMADPMACLNVMAYGAGDQLDWHFDRAEFAVTILLQVPENGGAFEYWRSLRTEEDPNYAGVRALLDGDRGAVQQVLPRAGSMTVFAGHNSAHRVAPVGAGQPRLMAVLSYMEQPDYHYSAADRIRFYGRADPDEA